MKRRQIFQLALATLAYPPLLRAQPARKPARIGVLSSTSPEARSAFWDAFKEGMGKLGWIEGHDAVYVYRYTRGDSTRFDALATELAAEKPDLIFAGTTPAALAAKHATRQVPIVFAYAIDPIGSALVASLRRPGGNVTGLTGSSPEIRSKLLELLKEIVPKLRRVAVLVSSGNVGQRAFGDVERVARVRGIEAISVVAANDGELDKTLQSLPARRVDGILFLGPPGLTVRRQVTERLIQMKLPAIHVLGEMVDAGGLLSYGASLTDNYRRAAEYVDRILKGTKPADLPVQQPITFELAVNLKTARAEGITIPQSVLFRATRVIE